MSIPNAARPPRCGLEPGTLPCAAEACSTGAQNHGLGHREPREGGHDCERVAGEEFARSISGQPSAHFTERPFYFLQKILPALSLLLLQS